MDTTTTGTRPERARTARPAARARFSPRTRKAILLLHVIGSMTWLGLDVGLLTLGVTGYTTEDPGLVRATYLAMDLLGDTVLVPAALLALVTGILLGAGTRWGLIRHRWVLTKLVLTIVTVIATFFALRASLHEAAAGVMADPPDPGAAGESLLFAPAVSLACYTFMAVVSIFKPWGRTRWGRRATTA